MQNKAVKSCDLFTCNGQKTQNKDQPNGLHSLNNIEKLPSAAMWFEGISYPHPVSTLSPTHTHTHTELNHNPNPSLQAVHPISPQPSPMQQLPHPQHRQCRVSNPFPPPLWLSWKHKIPHLSDTQRSGVRRERGGKLRIQYVRMQ